MLDEDPGNGGRGSHVQRGVLGDRGSSIGLKKRHLQPSQTFRVTDHLGPILQEKLTDQFVSSHSRKMECRHAVFRAQRNNWGGGGGWWP